MKRITLAILFLVHAALAADAPSFLDREPSWISTNEGKQVIANIISWQNADGGWFKAYDATTPRPATLPVAEPTKFPIPLNDSDEIWHRVSTIDNRATFSELRLLALAYTATKEEKTLQSFERGLRYLFDAQYPNGGWPQRFPLQDNYGRHITFNDGAMLGVMELMRDIAAGKPEFKFVRDADRKHAADAFAKGVQCILDCQIKVNGQLTGWCQQHDAITLAPAGARTYELPSITADESSRILMLLMSLEHPSHREKEAIEGGVKWLEQSKITGKRFIKKPDPNRPGKFDGELIDDPTGEPLWARFYDLETNRPFYCGRDGVKKASLSEIEPERRGGYAWIRNWGAKVLVRYREWKSQHGEN